MLMKPKSVQSGLMLIEAIVAVAIFAIGVLGMVGLQARMHKSMGDAKYRAEAAILADQLLGVMWSDSHGGPWDPTHFPPYANNMSTYNNFSDARVAACGAFAGKASDNINVKQWLGAADSSGSVLNLLPGSSAESVRVWVDAGNAVEITLCWQVPGELKSDGTPLWRSYQVSSVIRG